MYIHKLLHSGHGRITATNKRVGGAGGKIASSGRKTIGSGLEDLGKVYEDGKLKKATEVLRGLRVSKPRVPKKYISLD